MTEERKRYLASISKEEQAIRRTIREYKSRIRNAKEYICRFKNEQKTFGIALIYAESKDDVRYYNSVIKALKKQLPAPELMVENDFFYSYHCPICKTENMDELCYCPWCGQKLR